MKTIKNYKTFLDDLVCEYCPTGGYCLLKEYLIVLQSDPRMLIQLKCLEKYKYELSSKSNKDVGWSDTLVSWVESGLAKKFADLYTISPDIPFKLFYSRLRDT
jgi:hypothetical protein